MALMRAYVDKRTLTSLAADGTVTFAHGLLGVPDAVFFRPLTVGATASVPDSNLRGIVDATNVTVNNCGAGGSSNFEVCTVAFHSMIQ